MKKLTVNNGKADSPLKISVIEKKYNAKYVGQFCLKDKYGNWVNSSAEIFWQAVPPQPEFSNYFAIIIQNGTLMITNGASAVEGTIVGIRADDGEIIYSRYRHDYRISTDKSVMIDGGRDYTKVGENAQLVNMVIVDGEFYEEETINNN